MPTYEYACKACGEHLEVVQSFKDGALTECPGCGGLLRKVFGNIGITFKGSGFYRTDNRASGHRAAAGRLSGEGKAAAEGTDAGAGGGEKTLAGASSEAGTTANEPGGTARSASSAAVS